jgi:hypothetical protein
LNQTVAIGLATKRQSLVPANETDGKPKKVNNDIQLDEDSLTISRNAENAVTVSVSADIANPR